MDHSNNAKVIVHLTFSASTVLSALKDRLITLAKIQEIARELALTGSVTATNPKVIMLSSWRAPVENAKGVVERITIVKEDCNVSTGWA